MRVTAGTLRIFYENMPEDQEIVNGSFAELEEEEEAANETMIQNHEKYRVTVSWIKRGIHKGMLDS